MPTQYFPYLASALEQAGRGKGSCAPNPAVGAVLVTPLGEVTSGFHQGPGNPHAEVNAIRAAKGPTQGGVLYVTLEPCCHFGRTPPCTEFIIKSKISQVVYGYQDPNPVVRGKGAAALIEHGVEVIFCPQPEMTEFYRSYHHWLMTGRPWVSAKIALSRDGKVAGPQGERIKLSGEALDQKTHEERKNSDAILTGIQTVIRDNPRMDVRLTTGSETKPIYVVDNRLEFPLQAQMLKTTRGVTLFHVASASRLNRKALVDLGVQLVEAPNENGRVNLEWVFNFIAKAGVHDLWVESGPRLFKALWSRSLINRALFYECSVIVGEKGLAADLGPIPWEMWETQWQKYGSDRLCEVILTPGSFE